MLLVAKWFNTVWFGMFKTLLSSFMGMLPLRILLLSITGRVGDGGRLFITVLALVKRDDSSSASKSARN